MKSQSIRRMLCGIRWVLVLPLAMASLGAAGRGSSLVEAVKAGDAASIRTLLQQRVDVNAPAPDGSTALHWAAHRDNLAVVERLLKAGANPKATNRYGVTPLALACENGNAAIAERLLKAGADPNAAQPGGETALMTAARTGKVDTLKVLLAHGATVSARESTRQQTALMWAAAAGNAEAIRMLVEGGADLAARSAAPEHPRKFRDENNGRADDDIKMDASGLPFGAYTPLLFAVRNGRIEAVKTLLDLGADPKDKAVVQFGEPPMSALTVAVANGHYELAVLLLDRGADPNAMENGYSPLHLLARARSEPGVTRVPFGWTPGPTMTGKISGVELARKLVEHGADVNAQMTRQLKDQYTNVFDRRGATPIALAAHVVDVELIKVLGALGADPNIALWDGITPLMLATGVGLRSPGLDGGPFELEDTLPAVKALVAMGTEINATDVRGWTPLHGAAFKGINSVVEYLVDQGADLSAAAWDVKIGANQTKQKGQTDTGWLPLTVAEGMVITNIFSKQPHTGAFPICSDWSGQKVRVLVA